jgi:glutathione peroxidase
MSIYDFAVKTNEGKEISLAQYKGKVLLIVNTASKCGFTPQYKELQQLYENYQDKGLEILAFPCNQFLSQEPGSDEEIAGFCSLNFGVTFPLMAKIDVNGENAHPLYQYLQKNSPGVLGKAIKWNFTKFLIDAEGTIAGRFSPTTAPLKLSQQIEKLLDGVSV